MRSASARQTSSAEGNDAETATRSVAGEAPGGRHPVGVDDPDLGRLGHLLDDADMDLQLCGRPHLEQLVSVPITGDDDVDARHQTRWRGYQRPAGRGGEGSQHVEGDLIGGEGAEDLRLSALGQIEDYVHASRRV